jgi:hypothetical protein
MFVWPPLLKLPSESLSVVYLDLNHWISLAQAAVGHRSGRAFARVLEACRAARKAETAMFVLSGAHYAEMVKIKDPAQRRAIADVMEDLTDFSTLVSRVVVMTLETEAVLDRIAPSPGPLQPVSLIGRGARHAFGKESGLRIIGPTGDETESFRGQIGEQAFGDFVWRANLMLERSILAGPTDEEIGRLRALGWNPEPSAWRLARPAATSCG